MALTLVTKPQEFETFHLNTRKCGKHTCSYYCWGCNVAYLEVFPSNISNKLYFLIYYFNSLLILFRCPTYYILSIHSQDFSSPYQNTKWLTILPLFTFPLNHIHHFGPPLTLSFWALPLLIKTFNACPFGIKSHSFVFYLFIYRFPILSPPLQKSPKYKQSWKVPLR